MPKFLTGKPSLIFKMFPRRRHFGVTAGGILLVVLASVAGKAADYPRGFFVEDLSVKPPVPAFYDLETHQVDAFPFRQVYSNFIDITWDREEGRVFFSARRTPKDPYRVYLKPWRDGDEKIIYENPLGPFRFLLSPDGRRMVIQVMGPSAWPILAVHEWETSQTTLLGVGFSPDWSNDGKRILFLQIPGSLPTWLAEYQVTTGTTTRLLNEPVAEAVYTDDPAVILLKTAKQAKTCDVFHVWNRVKDSMEPFSVNRNDRREKHCVSQRELNAFPGHQFLFFKESLDSEDVDGQTLVIADPAGGRLQTISREDWDPMVTAVDSITLAIGEDPLYVISADGTGERRKVPRARFLRFKK